jgi:hypothetical protein
MSVTFDDRLLKADGVLFQELEGESVLLHVSKGEYFGLNESGHRMWLILTESDSIQQAYEKLLADYDVEPDHLKRELGELVENLVENELVQVAEQAA